MGGKEVGREYESEKWRGGGGGDKVLTSVVYFGRIWSSSFDNFV